MIELIIMTDSTVIGLTVGQILSLIIGIILIIGSTISSVWFVSNKYNKLLKNYDDLIVTLNTKVDKNHVTSQNEIKVMANVFDSRCDLINAKRISCQKEQEGKFKHYAKMNETSLLENNKEHEGIMKTLAGFIATLSKQREMTIKIITQFEAHEKYGHERINKIT